MIHTTSLSLSVYSFFFLVLRLSLFVLLISVGVRAKEGRVAGRIGEAAHTRETGNLRELFLFFLLFFPPVCVCPACTCGLGKEEEEKN